MKSDRDYRDAPPDDAPEAPVETRRWIAGADDHAGRLDKVLALHAPEFSRGHLQQLIADGRVTLDDQPCRQSSRRVRAGQAISVALVPTAQALAFRPQPMTLPIVFEDAHLLVVDKPAGLVVHPGAGNWSGTLLNGLLAHHAEAARLPRAGIVHRLDKDTSGLMVVARTLRAHASLVEQLSGRDVHRQYLAVVQGTMVAGTTINAPIGRHPTDRVRMAVAKEGGGRDAITHYRVREKFRAHTLVECRLETGRTHQIRAHMLHLGLPMVGDPLYGGGRALPRALAGGVAHQQLHAARLGFTHPRTGARMRFFSPPEAPFLALCAALGIDEAAWADT